MSLLFVMTLEGSPQNLTKPFDFIASFVEAAHNIIAFTFSHHNPKMMNKYVLLDKIKS